MYLNSHAEDRRGSTCFTGTLLGLHRQAIHGGWSAEHYQRIAGAHSDRYPMGYWLWMRCAKGVQR